MPWRRIDDAFDVHPKVERLRALGPRRFASAVAVWTLAGCPASRADGTFTWEEVRRQRVHSARRALQDLVEVGLVLVQNPAGKWSGKWPESGPVSGRKVVRFRFHDWTDYNETEEEKEAKKQANRERQRRFREKRAAERNALVTPPRTRTRPDPVPPPPSEESPPGEKGEPGEFRLEVVETPEVAEAKKVQDVFECWRELHATARSTLTDKRKKRIRARLREGVPVATLKAAIRGALADPWSMGVAKNSTKAYRGIDTILRDADKVDQLAALDGKPPARPEGAAQVGDFSTVRESGTDQLARMMEADAKRKGSR
jgi:hypothetical protein